MVKRAKRGTAPTDAKLRKKINAVINALNINDVIFEIPPIAVHARALLVTLEEKLEKENPEKYNVIKGKSPTENQLKLLKFIHSKCRCLNGYKLDVDFERMNAKQVKDFISTWKDKANHIPNVQKGVCNEGELLVVGGKLHQKLVSVQDALGIPGTSEVFSEITKKRALILLETYQEMLFQTDPVKFKDIVGTFAAQASLKQKRFMDVIHDSCMGFPEYSFFEGYNIEEMNKYEAKLYIKTWEGFLDAPKKDLNRALDLSKLRGDIVPVDSNGKHTRRVVREYLRMSEPHVYCPMNEFMAESDIYDSNFFKI